MKFIGEKKNTGNEKQKIKIISIAICKLYKNNQSPNQSIIYLIQYVFKYSTISSFNYLSDTKSFNFLPMIKL
jgi:hypothetical protein